VDIAGSNLTAVPGSGKPRRTRGEWGKTFHLLPDQESTLLQVHSIVGPLKGGFPGLIVSAEEGGRDVDARVAAVRGDGADGSGVGALRRARPQAAVVQFPEREPGAGLLRLTLIPGQPVEANGRTGGGKDADLVKAAKLLGYSIRPATSSRPVRP
jgi:hypothetical protein